MKNVWKVGRTNQKFYFYNFKKDTVVESSFKKSHFILEFNQDFFGSFQMLS